MPINLNFAKLGNDLYKVQHFRNSLVLQCAQRGSSVSYADSRLTKRNRLGDMADYAANAYSSVFAFVLIFPLTNRLRNPVPAYQASNTPVEPNFAPMLKISASIQRRNFFVKYLLLTEKAPRARIKPLNIKFIARRRAISVANCSTPAPRCQRKAAWYLWQKSTVSSIC